MTPKTNNITSPDPTHGRLTPQGTSSAQSQPQSHPCTPSTPSRPFNRPTTPTLLQVLHIDAVPNLLHLDPIPDATHLDAIPDTTTSADHREHLPPADYNLTDEELDAWTALSTEPSNPYNDLMFSPCDHNEATIKVQTCSQTTGAPSDFFKDLDALLLQPPWEATQELAISETWTMARPSDTPPLTPEKQIIETATLHDDPTARTKGNPPPCPQYDLDTERQEAVHKEQINTTEPTTLPVTKVKAVNQPNGRHPQTRAFIDAAFGSESIHPLLLDTGAQANLMSHTQFLTLPGREGYPDHPKWTSIEDHNNKPILQATQPKIIPVTIGGITKQHTFCITSGDQETLGGLPMIRDHCINIIIKQDRIDCHIGDHTNPDAIVPTREQPHGPTSLCFVATQTTILEPGTLTPVRCHHISTSREHSDGNDTQVGLVHQHPALTTDHYSITPGIIELLPHETLIPVWNVLSTPVRLAATAPVANVIPLADGDDLFSGTGNDYRHFTINAATLVDPDSIIHPVRPEDTTTPKTPDSTDEPQAARDEKFLDVFVDL